MQFGTPLTEQLGVQYRYSLYNQNVTLNPASLAAVPSLPIRQAALAGPQWVSSVGDTVSYNTLDHARVRPAASIRNSGRISPGWAAM